MSRILEEVLEATRLGKAACSGLQPEVLVHDQHPQIGKARLALDDGGYATDAVRRAAIACLPHYLMLSA